MPWTIDYPQDVRDRLAEYFVAGIVNSRGLDAVESELIRWSDRIPRTLMPRDVDFAVLICVFGAGDTMGGMACLWQFGQKGRRQ